MLKIKIYCKNQLCTLHRIRWSDSIKTEKQWWWGQTVAETKCTKCGPKEKEKKKQQWLDQTVAERGYYMEYLVQKISEIFHRKQNFF